MLSGLLHVAAEEAQARGPAAPNNTIADRK
jgi:hypothetical protein